jgi:hypothetical protein
MACAALLRVLIGLFSLATMRFEGWLFEPPDHDTGAAQGSANVDRTGTTSGGATLDGGAGLPSSEGHRARPRGQNLRLIGSTATALHPAACSVPPSEAQAHSARHNGHEPDSHRQGGGPAIEGRGPWTYR